MEPELGFHHCEHNVLLDADLDLGSASLVHFDWAHNFFIGGVFVVEADALMELLKKRKQGVPVVREYLQHFCWPKGYAAADKIADTGRLNGTMSEYMSFVPVLREYLIRQVGPDTEWQPAVTSMLSLCDLVNLLQRTSVPGAVSPARLRAAIVEHSQMQQRAYGVSLWLPKSHYNQHLDEQLEANKLIVGEGQQFLLNTLVNERKHKEVKMIAKEHESKVSYERGVMEEVTARHLYNLGTRDDFGSVDLRLESTTSPSPKVLDVIRSDFGADITSVDVHVARSAYVKNRLIVSGDVCLYGDDDRASVCQVWLHATIRGAAWSCVVPWQFHEHNHALAARYIVGDTPGWIRTAELLIAVIYSRATAGQASHLLLPPHVSQRLL